MRLLFITLSLWITLASSLAAQERRGEKRPRQGPAQSTQPLGAVIIRCSPQSVLVGSQALTPVQNPIAQALDHAGPGSRILLEPGDYPSFSLGFTKSSRHNSRTSGGTPGQPIMIEGLGRVRILAGNGGDTISIGNQTRAGHVQFKNLEIECGYRTAVIFYATNGQGEYPSFHFEDCDIVGNFDHLTGQGARSKWGVWGSCLSDFRFVGVTRRAVVRDIRAEHGFYLQNPKGNILIENVDAMRLGRTFLQLVSRPKEGPAGSGHVTLRNCHVSDVCLASGDNFKGGSAFTFAGRHSGTILVEGCTYRAGFVQELCRLTRPEEPYGTGALVAWDQGVGLPTRLLILKDNDFAFAPGCGDRAVVSLGGCSEVRLIGKNRFAARSDGLALEIDPLAEGDLKNSPIGRLVVESPPQILGRIERRAAAIEPAQLSSEVQGE